jgi:hypothetical protein
MGVGSWAMRAASRTCCCCGSVYHAGTEMTQFNTCSQPGQQTSDHGPRTSLCPTHLRVTL